MDAKHTPGPWRWEVNEKSKVVQLCGGERRYDVTVMDFVRWGMGGATPRFRDASDHGLLTKCIHWAQKVIGREHHSSWFKSLDHPDARLIAAAPDLLAALKKLLRISECADETGYVEGHGFVDIETAQEEATAAIAKAEGRAA